jgi:small subunit ribosomal protein S4
MSNYTGPFCRLCRRERVKLYLKGEKCYTDKCPLEFSKSKKSRGVPGAKGRFRRRLTDYGVQLREKQKLRRYYLITEKQFSNYVKKSGKIRGTKSENLFKLLESRLDIIIYRLGIGSSKKHARQLVTHGFFSVNSRKVNIPSYLVKQGDIIEFNKSILERHSNLKDIVKDIDDTKIPEWLKLNKDLCVAEVVEDIMGSKVKENYFVDLKENLIIEYYSR